MQNMDFNVIFYDKPGGTFPAKDYLDSLDNKMFVKITRNIEVIEAGGTTVREPYSKYLQDGIFEVRAQVSSNLARVLYFFFDGRRIILTHGFTKKTQKTPPAEIELAKKYRAEYLSREESKQ